MSGPFTFSSDRSIPESHWLQLLGAAACDAATNRLVISASACYCEAAVVSLASSQSCPYMLYMTNVLMQDGKSESGSGGAAAD